MKVRLERNKQTGKWRYYDTVIKQYSSEEWDKREKAWGMLNKYYDLMYGRK